MQPAGLKRAGTLQAPQLKGHHSQGYPSQSPPSPTNADEDEDDEGLDQESYFPPPNQNQYPTSPMGKPSPWAAPGPSGNEWRGPGSNGNAVDDVSRALNALELNQNYQSGQASQHPPRFNPAQLPPQALRRGSQSGPNTPGGNNNNSTYVPPIGHPLALQPGSGPGHPGRERSMTASSGQWEQKERILGSRSSNPSLHQLYQNQLQQGGRNGDNIPNVPPIPAQFLNQSQPPRLGLSNNFNTGGQGQNSHNGGNNSNNAPLNSNQGDASVNTPVDVPTLIATKGYNPVDFDIKPVFVRVKIMSSLQANGVF